MTPTALITGFAPFDGRPVNSSWVAARTLASQHDSDEMRALEIAVIWGEPRRVLTPIFESGPPGLVIALGEGRTGWFDIETVARNTRKPRRDENGDLPPHTASWPGGPGRVRSALRSEIIGEGLRSCGFPVRISTDAGGFLCEETLFAMEYLKTQYEPTMTTIFVHLPPYNTSMLYKGREGSCSDELLSTFVERLWGLVLGEYMGTG